MKAAVLEEIKHPLHIRELDIPKPGPGELILKQKVTGICYRDILTQEGYFPRAQLPIVPGHEISGTVVAVGPDVSDFSVGDRVSSLIYRPCGECKYCLSGRENLCPSKQIYGETLQGSYAEYIAVHQNSAVKVPDNVGDHEAAIAACVTGMILHALKREGGMKEGDTLLISGSGGGVGIHAVQIGKILGARVIAETSSEEKVDAIKSLGADEVVLYHEHFDKDVKKIAPGGVDVAFETTGIYTFEQSLRSLSPGGRLVVVGNLKPDPVRLPLGLIILKGNSVIGSISSTREDLREALELSSRGAYRAMKHDVRPISEANQAFESMKKKESRGRVFLNFE